MQTAQTTADKGSQPTHGPPQKDVRLLLKNLKESIAVVRKAVLAHKHQDSGTQPAARSDTAPKRVSRSSTSDKESLQLKVLSPPGAHVPKLQSPPGTPPSAATSAAASRPRNPATQGVPVQQPPASQAAPRPDKSYGSLHAAGKNPASRRQSSQSDSLPTQTASPTRAASNARPSSPRKTTPTASPGSTLTKATRPSSPTKPPWLPDFWKATDALKPRTPPASPRPSTPTGHRPSSTPPSPSKPKPAEALAAPRPLPAQQASAHIQRVGNGGLVMDLTDVLRTPPATHPRQPPAHLLDKLQQRAQASKASPPPSPASKSAAAQWSPRRAPDPPPPAKLPAAPLYTPSGATTQWHKQVSSVAQLLADSPDILPPSPSAASRAGSLFAPSGATTQWHKRVSSIIPDARVIVEAPPSPSQLSKSPSMRSPSGATTQWHKRVSSIAPLPDAASAVSEPGAEHPPASPPATSPFSSGATTQWHKRMSSAALGPASPEGPAAQAPELPSQPQVATSSAPSAASQAEPSRKPAQSLLARKAASLSRRTVETFPQGLEVESSFVSAVPQATAHSDEAQSAAQAHGTPSNPAQQAESAPAPTSPQPASRRVTADTDEAPLFSQGPPRRSASIRHPAEAAPQLSQAQARSSAAQAAGQGASRSAPGAGPPDSTATDHRPAEAAEQGPFARKGSLLLVSASEDAQGREVKRSVSFKQGPDSPGRLGEHRRKPSIFARERPGSSEAAGSAAAANSPGGAAAGAGEGQAQRRTSTAQLNHLFGELDSLERNFRRMSSSRKAPVERPVMLLEEAGRQGLAALPEEQSGVF